MVTDKPSAKLTPEVRRAMECEGKESFGSYRRASRVARKQSLRHDSVAFHVYRCQTCGALHIGAQATRRFDPLTPEEERGWKGHERLLRKRNRTRAQG